jgi:hypothetical protein
MSWQTRALSVIWQMTAALIWTFINRPLPARWKATGTPRIEFAGIKPDGKPVTITAIHIHRVQDGKLIEHWEAINLHAVQPNG